MYWLYAPLLLAGIGVELLELHNQTWRQVRVKWRQVKQAG